MQVLGSRFKGAGGTQGGISPSHLLLLISALLFFVLPLVAFAQDTFLPVIDAMGATYRLPLTNCPSTGITYTRSTNSFGCSSAGGTVGGTGTSPRLAQWSSTSGLTDSAVGTSVLGGLTAGSVLFGGALGVLTQDNAHLFYDPVQGRLGLGTNTFVFADAIDTGILVLEGTNTNVLWRNVNGSILDFARSGGTNASPTASSAGQVSLWTDIYGHDGTAYGLAAEWTAGVDATPSSGIVPGFVSVKTTDTAGTLRERLRLTSVGTTAMATPATTSTVVTAGQVEMQTGPLVVGLAGQAPTWTGFTYGQMVVGTQGSTKTDLFLRNAGNGEIVAPAVQIFASAGTLASPSNLTIGQTIGSFLTNAFAGSAYTQVAAIDTATTAATSGAFGGQITLSTRATSGSVLLAMTVDATQTIILSGNLLAVLPASQTITAGATIAADACGGYKRISSASAVTTSTTNTITAPAAANAGCVMHLCNVNAADAITLDKNANILLTGGADVALGAGCCIDVGSTGASGVWKQMTAQLCSS